MVEGFYHRARIQLEKDEKSTNFTKKEISPTSSSKIYYNMKKKLENFIKRDFIKHKFKHKFKNKFI